MAVVTVAEVLQMPVLSAARPEVLAGKSGLDRQVRWVHTTELADIAPLLRGGDLVLSTGIAFPDSAEDLDALARSLNDSDARVCSSSWAGGGHPFPHRWSAPVSGWTSRSSP